MAVFTPIKAYLALTGRIRIHGLQALFFPPQGNLWGLKKGSKNPAPNQTRLSDL